jgi:hypothetical protein
MCLDVTFHLPDAYKKAAAPELSAQPRNNRLFRGAHLPRLCKRLALGKVPNVVTTRRGFAELAADAQLARANAAHRHTWQSAVRLNEMRWCDNNGGH